MTFYDDFEGDEKDFGDVLGDFLKRNKVVVWWHTADDGTLRLCYVKDGERGFYSVGEISNDPTAHKPTIFSSPEEAEEYCYALNEKAGIFKAEVLRIVGQSMRMDPWRVTYDEDHDRVNIWHGDKIVASPEWFEAKQQLMPALLRELYGGSTESFQDELDEMAEWEEEGENNDT